MGTSDHAELGEQVRDRYTQAATAVQSGSRTHHETVDGMHAAIIRATKPTT